MPDYEVFDVFCRNCKKKIEKPSDCNMELFRLGYPLHNGGCLAEMERMLRMQDKLESWKHWGINRA